MSKAVDLELSEKDMRELIRGLDRVKDKFSVKKANTEINRAVFDAAKPMTQVMKDLAPVGDTKILKKSVGRWRTKSGVRVGARYRRKDSNKGWYVGFPTYPHKTRGDKKTTISTPFLADAFESTKGITADLIIKNINKLIGKFF